MNEAMQNPLVTDDTIFSAAVLCRLTVSAGSLEPLPAPNSNFM